MAFLYGWSDATTYQSVFQLGVAVTLTYLIAGPHVSKILEDRLTEIASLRSAVDALSDELPDDDILTRKAILYLHDEYLNSGLASTVKINTSTATYYVVAPMILFMALFLTSLLPKWPTSIVIVCCAVTAVLIFMDPIRVVWNAYNIRKMTDEVYQIVSLRDVRGIDGPKLLEAVTAMSELRTGHASIRNTTSKLKTLNMLSTQN